MADTDATLIASQLRGIIKQSANEAWPGVTGHDGKPSGKPGPPCFFVWLSEVPTEAAGWVRGKDVYRFEVMLIDRVKAGQSVEDLKELRANELITKVCTVTRFEGIADLWRKDGVTFDEEAEDERQTVFAVKVAFLIWVNARYVST